MHVTIQAHELAQPQNQPGSDNVIVRDSGGSNGAAEPRESVGISSDTELEFKIQGQHSSFHVTSGCVSTS